MSIEALPGERSVVLIETLNELEEHLQAGTDIDEGIFSAISMLLVDATLSGDDKALYEGIRKLKDLTLICKAGVKERLLGYIDVVAWARKRIIPKPILDQFGDEGNFHRRVLSALAQELRTRQDLCTECECDASVMEVALFHLEGMGMVSRRRLASRNFWKISPRGREALHLTRP